jgi:membrane protein
MKTIRSLFVLFFQRLWITFELFNRNGLMNHAAACAYGFLLSAAPALLFISFVVSRALTASPDLAESLLRGIGVFFSVFNAKDIINNFLSSSNSGLAGIISVVSIFWTARLCMLSAQRGLGVIFPGSRSVLKDNVVTLGLGLLAMFIIFIFLLGIRLALNLYSSSGFSSSTFRPVLFLSAQVFLILSLALLALTAYRFVPANPPKVKSIIPGVLACIVFYMIFNAGFTLLIDPNRYNLLYGTLGRLFLFLVNVYFFFIFFFFGAQFIQVLDISDALLFARFRQGHSKRLPSKNPIDKLFAVLPKPLEKYIAFYKKDDSIFALHSQGQDVYYILSGKAGVYLDNECRNRVAFIDEAHFFGEMASIASEGRAASIKAETDLSAIILPPELFRVILQIDPDTDTNIIKAFSERLKSVNQQIQSSTTASPDTGNDQ